MSTFAETGAATAAPGRGARTWAVLALLAGLAMPLRLGAQTIIVSTGQSATSSAVGEQFDLPVVVNMNASASLLGSFSLTLRWNPAVLQFVGGQTGNFGTVTANEDSVAAGAVFLSGANPAGVGGIITIGVGRFQSLASDTTTFGLTVSELYAAGTFEDLLPSVLVVEGQYCPGAGRYGDVDRDGGVDSRDALIALNNAVGLDVTGFDLTLADVDADGDADPRDALIILSYAIGLDVGAFRVLTTVPGTECAVGDPPVYTLGPTDVTALVGQDLVYTVLATDSIGNPIAMSGVSWTSSNPAVATVDSLGGAVAVAPGTADISVLQENAVVATTTLTVVGSRSVHWVDGLATEAVNQLGTPAYPFADIGTAVTAAAAGDTVYVRPGRYEEGVFVDRPLVLMGDTAGGGLRPLIAATGPFTTGIAISTAGLVELHSLRLDTLYLAVNVSSVDSLRVRNVEFRSSASGFANLYVTSVSDLAIEQSQFYGDASAQSFFTGNNAVYVGGGTGTVSVDSSLIADFGDYGLEFFGVDSLYMRGNTVRNNYGYGVYFSGADSAAAPAVVMMENRFLDNENGSFYLFTVGTALLEGNYFGAGTFSGNYIQGYTGSVFTFRDDTVATRQSTGCCQWLNAFGYDSLHVQGMVVDAGNASGYFQDGRVTVIRDSDFSNVDGTAIDAYTGTRYPAGTMILRNLVFQGPDSTLCDQCGYAVMGDQVDIDADSITGVNLYSGFEQYDSTLTLRNTTLTDVYMAVELNCGRLDAADVTMTDVDYGFYAYGCVTGDSVRVDNSSVTLGTYGVYTNDIPATVTNSVMSDLSYALYHFDSSLVYTDNQIVRPQFYGVYLDLNGTGATATVERNTVTCDAYGAANARGITAFDGPITVANDTVMNCWYGIEVGDFATTAATTTTEVLDSYVQASSIVNARGIYHRGYYDGARIARNTVTGLAEEGSIIVGSTASTLPSPWIEVDSNVVDGGLRVGIHSWYADTLRIRDNTVTNLGATTCCTSGAGGNGAIVVGYSPARSGVAEVLRNTVTNGASNGIVLARDFNDSVVVVVDSNVIAGVDSVGIWIDDYTNAVVRYNAIESAGLDAVLAWRINSTGTTDTVIIEQNNFSNSGRYGVYNLGTWETIAAANNYWNDPNGPSGSLGNQVSVGDSVSDFVIWDPALASPADAPVPAAAPRQVASFGSGPVLSVDAVTAVRQPSARPVRPSLEVTDLTPRRARALPVEVPQWMQAVLERDRAAAIERARLLERLQSRLDAREARRRQAEERRADGARIEERP